MTPARCVGPEGPRGWGWGVQLYALWSRQSWGIGDFGDLARLGRWSAREAGARLLLVSPADAVLPVLPQQPDQFDLGLVGRLLGRVGRAGPVELVSHS